MIRKLAIITLLSTCMLLPIGCVMEESDGISLEGGAPGDTDVDALDLTRDVPVNLAAPPCYGSGCNGLNPSATGCSNPANGKVETMQSISILRDQWSGPAVGGVELRYSHWCNARWSRAISYIGNVCIGAIMRNSADTYDIAGTGTYLCNNSDVFGNMYGGVVARAKGYLYMNQYANSYRDRVTAYQ